MERAPESDVEDLFAAAYSEDRQISGDRTAGCGDVEGVEARAGVFEPGMRLFPVEGRIDVRAAGQEHSVDEIEEFFRKTSGFSGGNDERAGAALSDRVDIILRDGAALRHGGKRIGRKEDARWNADDGTTHTKHLACQMDVAHFEAIQQNTVYPQTELTGTGGTVIILFQQLDPVCNEIQGCFFTRVSEMRLFRSNEPVKVHRIL